MSLCETLEFPVTFGYIDTSGPFGPIYYGDDYDWYVVEDVGPVAVACLRRDGSVTHLAILETALSKRGRGYGKTTVGLVEGLYPNDDVTLYAREPWLVAFYVGLGYNLIDNQKRFMEKKRRTT